MRVTREQALATRRHILETAAALFREHGFDGIGVADLMKRSGLTHGAFYRHFASKDDLAAEAVSLAYEQLEAETVGKSIDALLGRYISVTHRDDLSGGCPTSALGAEAMRQADVVQPVFSQGVATWLQLIDEALIGKAPNKGERRAKAIELGALAVGAVVLSRAAAADGALSDEILRVSLDAALAAAGDS